MKMKIQLHGQQGEGCYLLQSMKKAPGGPVGLREGGGGQRGQILGTHRHRILYVLMGTSLEGDII
jgi:hypothetical protein